MDCKICSHKAAELFKADVLKKYSVQYYHCTHCNFIFTENPYWLNEAYANPINYSDTGLLHRNIFYARVLSVLLFVCYKRRGKFLDFAGGYGIFSRLMRDNGFDFYWNDPFTQNLFAYGFDLEHSGSQQFEMVTSFESFEHFVNPLEELEKILTYSNNVFFSTELFSGNPPGQKDWWYYSFDHGQHVSFYSQQSLETIANKYQLNFYSFGDYHLLTKKKLNSVLLFFIPVLAKLGFAYPVKKIMKDKIWSDHLLVKQLERKE